MKFTIEEILQDRNKVTSLKMMRTKNADPSLKLSTQFVKEINKAAKKSTKMPNMMVDTATVEAVANTYYWLDSHGDVHVKGCFTRSINNSIKNIYPIDNHTHTWSGVIGETKTIIEAKTKWRDLGVDKDGSTICVVPNFVIDEDYNKQAFDAYCNNLVYNHSVGMIYINIELAYKTDSKDYQKENKLFEEIYPLLGNPEQADKDGYFWVVREARLKEYSSLLWDGSNSITPTNSVTVDSPDGTQSNISGSSSDTRKSEIQIIKNLKLI